MAGQGRGDRIHNPNVTLTQVFGTVIKDGPVDTQVGGVGVGLCLLCKQNLVLTFVYINQVLGFVYINLVLSCVQKSGFEFCVNESCFACYRKIVSSISF